MQISGHKCVASISNYSTMNEERHKEISNILSNTETIRNALVPCTVVSNFNIHTLQPVALLMFREIYEKTLKIYISGSKLVSICNLDFHLNQLIFI